MPLLRRALRHRGADQSGNIAILLGIASTYNKTDGDVYISIIPFTKDVNVGTRTSTSPGSTG